MFTQNWASSARKAAKISVPVNILMKVTFRKTGERRYGVYIERENFPDLEMNPAPGYDELMPHDLLHFLVEQEFHIKNAIFGQIADGGTAGTFRQTSPDKSSDRAESRLRKKTAKRGEKLLKIHLDDCAKSERATYICLYDWFAHSTDADLRARASEMKKSADSVYSQMSEAERKTFTPEKLAHIRAGMDEISANWSQLKINESISLDW